ncbi:VOC family protein [Actinocrinis puniceicyclus]|uniref:VOC family protein n=1 Tax=Actinocrinis puniceicyclus TaxID=977794 RepID=A0A8J8BHG5_9ACTN|nr:VOC family protein [Actinocrinis puniceicyclus]MBS2966774.1 VOC family protein [Actinocrinis puniceicyclus]
MRLDHVSYACRADAFPSTLSRLGSLLGAAFRDGGVHPRYGTRNAVLPLDGGCYVEIVAPLEHPSTDTMPFGRAVRRRAALGGGWLGWVVAVDDLAPFEQRLGRAAAEGHRRRPDGTLLQWRQIGLLDLLRDPQIPYLVEWDCPRGEHPSADADGTVGIERLQIAGRRAAILDWLGTPEADPLPHVHVDWLEPTGPAQRADESGLVAVDFRTAHGPVRID